MVAQLIDQLVCMRDLLDSPKGCQLAMAFIRIGVCPLAIHGRSAIRSVRLDTPQHSPKKAIDVPGFARGGSGREEPPGIAQMGDSA